MPREAVIRHLLFGFVLAFVATLTSLSAEESLSFSGTWKLNAAESQFAPQTITIKKTATGLLHLDSGGFNYHFDLSGTPFPMPDGGTTAWRAVNATTWEATNRLGRAVIGQRLQIDEQTATTMTRLTESGSGVWEPTTTYARIAGISGFLGKWRSMQGTEPARTIQIAVNGPSIVMNFPESQVICHGRFDGRDNPVTVGGVVSKETWAFRRTAASSFTVTVKLSGKPFYVDKMTLSDEGDTLTDEGRPVSVNDIRKAVYERQP